MTARLPIPTPDQLVQQWTPMMRRLAFTTGTEFDDIRQEAWLLAATMPHGRERDDDFVARWLTAVRCHAAAQRPGVTVRPSPSAGRAVGAEEYIGSAWLAGSADDDPCNALVAAENVGLAVGGETGDDTARWMRIRQEIELPRAAWEIAQARGCSARHARRKAARLRELEGVQADLFSHEEEEGDEK